MAQKQNLNLEILSNRIKPTGDLLSRNQIVVSIIRLICLLNGASCLIVGIR